MYSKENPLRIYLADLTYDTVSITSDVFPLNIGYIASYCKKRFGDLVEIKLFKFIKKLEKAILENPPHLLGLSNYVWNHRLGLEMFRLALEQNPQVLTVWGGPNFPADMPSQETFLYKYKEVDAYVPIDGETGFSNIVAKVLELGQGPQLKQKFSQQPIDGCITRDVNGKLQYSNPVIRIAELDEIPSPYLSGFMDEFFDNQLTPMLQTNRGCPFSCTFCTDGSDLVKRVNKFSLDRTRKELEYIAEHVPSNMKNIMISDLNFGMFPRDLEICDYFVELQKKYRYPEQIQTTTGKNNKTKIIQSVKQLSGTLRLSMSVQSMDQQVLTNVRRDNISLDHMLAIAPAIKEANLGTDSEVIIGLPGETYQSHVKTLRDLTRAQMDHIMVFNCMMLNGAELSTPESRKKFDLKTKFRVLVRDFTKLSSGKNVVEAEEVLIASDSMTFDEYVKLRALDYSVYMINIGVVFAPLLKFLRQQNVDVFDVPLRMLEESDKHSPVIAKIYQDFKNETRGELWDSLDELEKNFQKDSEYDKLLTGEVGLNILHYYTGLVSTEYMDEWINYTLEITREIIKEKLMDDNLAKQYKDIENFVRGLGHNIAGKDRLHTTVEDTFQYDIQRWVSDTGNLALEQFRFDSPTRVMFCISKVQYMLLQEQLEIYGDKRITKAELIKRLPLQTLWRMPVKFDTQKTPQQIEIELQNRQTKKTTIGMRRYHPRKDN